MEEQLATEAASELEQKATEAEQQPAEAESTATEPQQIVAETVQTATEPQQDVSERALPSPAPQEASPAAPDPQASEPEQRASEPERKATAPEQKRAVALFPPAALEVWAQNERMRHIPPVSWMIEKVDGDLRRRIEMEVSVFDSLASADPRHQPIEEVLRGICDAFDDLAEAARHGRGPLHPPAEIAHRIPWSINTALSALRNVDASMFGRRQPFHTFERSPAEAVYAALLVVIQQIERAVPLIREIDPAIDERLNASLVRLEEPMRAEPIA
jgi:hypothetical protein